MLRKIAASLAIIASVSTLVSAAVSFDTLNKTNLQDEIANLDLSVPQAVIVEDKSVSSKLDKEWTIMVYVNGKNNLEPYALKDMNEMEKIGSTDKVNVVTETGLIAGYGTLPWTGTARFLIKKDNDTNKVTSPILQNLGKSDMGDYKNVVAFVKWAQTNYPAKHYMLVVWNHGAGWIKSRSPEVTKGISYDDETGNHINTPQMGLMMKGIGKIDVYGSDACLMQMPEVDYEIKDYVNYIVGSEETEPGDGYTYDLLLGPLVKKPTMSAMELGKLAVNAYADHYGTQDHTQSLVDSAKLNGLVAPVNAFVKAAMAANEKALIKSAMSSAQAYAYAENKDLWHFLSLYAASSKNANVKAAAKSLQDYLTGDLVLLNRANANYANSHGLAIYMPNYTNSAYNALAWANATQWDEFIAWYTAK